MNVSQIINYYNSHHLNYEYGTPGTDSLQGTSGNDSLYGGMGDDLLHGGAGNDIISAASDGAHSNVHGDWGRDTAWGDAGNDSLDFSMTTHGVTLFGDGQTWSATDGNDFIIGGSGNDTILGGGGNDWLYGGAGDDTIYGGYSTGIGSTYASGDDHITGGPGADTLWANGGDTTFSYNYGDSVPTQADHIMDFNTVHDRIELPGGTPAAGDFIELGDAYTNEGPFNNEYWNAYEAATMQLSRKDPVHYVLADLPSGNSVLFADTNHDGSFDFAIHLQGITADNHFDRHNIA